MVTGTKAAMLQFASEYGPGISFGGQGGKPRLAKELIADGLLEGEVQNCAITDAGLKALALPPHKCGAPTDGGAS